jgi:ATP-dependent exoDNAse (exonuclease V) alpha subunit
VVVVDRVTRENKEPQDDPHLQWKVVGDVTYLPLRLAFATTTHKSQGLSLDKVQVNISSHMFSSPGMLYVALSRARTPEGLRLVGTPQQFVQKCVYDKRVKGFL